MSTTALERPLTLNEVIELVGCSRATLMKWVEAGIFPRPSFKGQGRNGKLYWSRAAVARALNGRHGGSVNR